MRSATIVCLLLILFAPGPVRATGVFLSVDRDTDELVRLDADQQTVSVVGVLPFTATGVELSVLDGRRVRVLHRGRLASGPHTRIWDGLDAAGREVASGVYFAHLRAEDTARSRKITLVR